MFLYIINLLVLLFEVSLPLKNKDDITETNIYFIKLKASFGEIINQCKLQQKQQTN